MSPPSNRAAFTGIPVNTPMMKLMLKTLAQKRAELMKLMLKTLAQKRAELM
jgi:hypothetical protein